MSSDSARSVADLLLHPVRLRVVLALAGQQLTPKQLAHKLRDVPLPSLYRHLERLTAGGLLQVVAEERKRGAYERTYAVVQDAVRLSADAVADATSDDHLRYFATFVGLLLEQYGRYVRAREPDMLRDRVGYHVNRLWLSDAEFDGFAQSLAALLRDAAAHGPGAGRTARTVAFALFPDVGTQESGD